MSDVQTKPAVQTSDSSDESTPLFTNDTSMSAGKKFSNAWGVREVITVALMSVLTVLLMFAGGAFTMVNYNLAMLLSGGAAVLLGAPVFMLMTQRVNRSGIMTVFATICSLAFCTLGNFVFMIPFYIVGGILIDLLFLRKASQRSNLWFVTAAWTVFSGGYLLSTLIPMFMDLQGYIDETVKSRGLDQSFVNSFLYFYTSPTWVVTIMLITMACGFIGCLIGRMIVKRHFSKAKVQ